MKSSNQKIDKELQNKIDLGNKRLALVCSTMAFLLSIPLLFVIFMELVENEYYYFMVLGYMALVCISMLFAPKIIGKLYKD